MCHDDRLPVFLGLGEVLGEVILDFDYAGESHGPPPVIVARSIATISKRVNVSFSLRIAE
jgi:hypothetical protein